MISRETRGYGRRTKNEATSERCALNPRLLLKMQTTTTTDGFRSDNQHEQSIYLVGIRVMILVIIGRGEVPHGI